MPSKKDKTKYIKHTAPKKTWRPNPVDPFIYISFEPQQYEPVYGRINDNFGHGRISEECEAIYREMIEQEFATIGAPIRYLARNATPEEIRRKNVCFVDPMNLSGVDFSNANGGQIMRTTRVVVQDQQGNERVGATIMRIINFTKHELTNPIHRQQNFYSLKHEFGHGIACLKHGRSYTHGDEGPFENELTCQDTIMNYEDACPPVIEKAGEIKRKALSGEVKTREQTAKLFEELDAQYPSALGPVDKLAIQEVFSQWDAENQALATSVGLEYISSIPLHIHGTHFDNQHDHYMPEYLIRQALIDMHMVENRFGTSHATTLFEKFINYIQELVQSCPSYFASSGQSNWHNTNVFFNQSQNGSVGNQTLLPGNPSNCGMLHHR